MCCNPTVPSDGGQGFAGVQMPKGEVLLTVTGVPISLVQPPRGIVLAVLPVSDAQSWTYRLKEP